MEQGSGTVGGPQSGLVHQAQPRVGGTIVRVAFVIVAIIVLIAPGWVFFSQRGGLAFLEGADWPRANRLLFPLAGLYAFTLVWLQVMIGSNRRWLQSLFPGILRYHRWQGAFAFLLAMLHPLLLIGGIGLEAYLRDAFVAPDLVLFVWFGRLALFLLALTVATALLRRLQWLRRRWHAIHYLNYVIFVLVWIHSWMVGSDIRATGLRWLWLAFAATFIASALGRLVRRAARPARQTVTSSETPSAPAAD